MGENSKIEWTHHTLNPWRGCTKATYTNGDGKTVLHPGCLNCYAEKDRSVRMQGIRWGKGQERRPKAESGWAEPLAWARAATKAGERHRVFCASLADVLDPEVPDSMRALLWHTIRATARHSPSRLAPSDALSDWWGLDWLLLTKRPEEWRRIPEDVRPLAWLGTSISDQETADEWVPRLLAAEGFRYRFLSVEPLVGPVDLSRWFYAGHHPSWDGHPDRTPQRRLSWVIVGGESGPKARPCNVEWVRDIVKQCAEAGVPCFVKQLGAAPLWPSEASVPDDLWALWDASDDGAPANYPVTGGLGDSKGGNLDEWPEDLRVREFPR